MLGPCSRVFIPFMPLDIFYSAFGSVLLRSPSTFIGFLLTHALSDFSATENDRRQHKKKTCLLYTGIRTHALPSTGMFESTVDTTGTHWPQAPPGLRHRVKHAFTGYNNTVSQDSAVLGANHPLLTPIVFSTAVAELPRRGRRCIARSSQPSTSHGPLLSWASSAFS